MRITLFLLMIFPVVMNAQINRSATEFAKEKVEEYITGKLFKDNSYKPVSYGKLKSLDEKNSGIKWVIQHDFEITETHSNTGKIEFVKSPYRFAFYFDEKMKVLKAESWYAK